MHDSPAPSENRRRVQRRTLIKAGLAGLAAARLFPPVGSPAHAATVVTPDPIPARIGKSGFKAELLEFSTPPATSTQRPYAALNYMLHAGDGSGRLFACDSRGKLWRINSNTGAARLFLDLKQARGTAFLTGGQMGLRSFAFPNFGRAGRPGYRKLYTAHTETAASRPSGVRLFTMTPGIPIHHHNVVAEWSVDAADPSRVDPASRREVLRIAQHRPDHCTDTILFDPTAPVASANYGKLYIGIGDGGNTPERPDRYDHAQDPGRALGKIFRVDPLRRSDGRRYAVPADSPFVGLTGWLPEIWALGLRHPQNLCFDRSTGVLLVTDIGQYHIEEVNLGTRGANYGWPHREGTFATERTDETVLYGLPPDDAVHGYTYPVAQYDHDEGKDTQGQPIANGKFAIAGGFVYRGTAIPALVGHYLFGDLVNGRVFHVPVGELRPGSLATVRELTLTRNGAEVRLRQLVGTTTGRVDLRFGQGEGGGLFLLTKQDGKIRKLAAPA